MLSTCLYVYHMPTMIQLRHVPDDLHRKLKARAALAGMSLSDYLIARYPHHPFLSRIWELRHNATAYDATYLALAEALAAPLVTRDAKLASTTGHQTRIELL